MKTRFRISMYFSGFCLILFLAGCNEVSVGDSDHSAINSIETGHTITKIRSANYGKRNVAVATSFQGTVLAIDYGGSILWENGLSGIMNNDLWCDDLTGDGIDEVLAANADGSIYCLSEKGKLLWSFKTNEAPMKAVCVVHQDKTPFVVCGGYDKSIYYLSAKGQLIKEIKSSTYSKEVYKGDYPTEKYQHIANFLRPLKRSDGSEVLIVQAVNGMSRAQAYGSIYQFEPLAELPFHENEMEKTGRPGPIAAFRVNDFDRDGEEEVLMGTGTMVAGTRLVTYDPETNAYGDIDLSIFGQDLGFGYRDVHAESIPDGESFQYMLLVGSHIFLLPPSLAAEKAEVLTGKYSFNDMWKDPESQEILLSSSQSGGSCIHIMDTRNPGWKIEYESFIPPGNIETILAHTRKVRSHLEKFSSPEWEREPLPVNLLSERISEPVIAELVKELRASYTSPVFLKGVSPDKENWDRSIIESEVYRNKRDGRMKYLLTQQEWLDQVIPAYDGEQGISMWGGHGNDPFMCNPESIRKMVDAAGGKKTVLIYPEMGDHSGEFAYVLDNLFYPLAEYFQERNGNFFVRSKDVFWQGAVHKPMWSRLMSGEFADVFIPSMEETGNKTMDLSLAGRLGVWTSGAVNNWGARCARDNTSMSALRRDNHQMLPNHFLRQSIYSASLGARYFHNFAVDQEYMSLFWELLAKGALYVPKREEILSFSPVHLSIIDPDADYIREGNDMKWNVYFDEEREKKNPMVFSRYDGTWPGAPVTEWDFSRYASGVKDRRLHFIPPYPQGMVLITPPQAGPIGGMDLPRGALSENLHPLYRDILKEYFTDGRYYYNADKSERYSPEEYFRVIEKDIQESAEFLPLTVKGSGDIGWVVAQTSPTHLRLTLVDGGYINPGDKMATITFHSVRPKVLKDLLDGEEFDLANPKSVKVEVPCGMFRFIDIELFEDNTTNYKSNLEK